MGHPTYRAIHIGALPVEKINRALGTDLCAGEVWVSKACHAHIAQDHPGDYPFILAAITEIVAGPLYIGQDPKHGRNFYLVRPISPEAPNPQGLVSIGFELNQHGVYNVRSAYTISQETLDRRRRTGALHFAL